MLRRSVQVPLDFSAFVFASLFCVLFRRISVRAELPKSSKKMSISCVCHVPPFFLHFSTLA